MRGRRAAVIAACALAPAACTSRVTVVESPGEPGAESLLSRLVNTDNGLRVRKWVVADNPTRIAAALLAHADGWTLPPARRETLRRDGLRLVRVPADRVDALLGELGVAPLDVAAWHGQVTDWRELLHRPVGDEGAVIAAGGRVHRLEAGRLRLMIRSWTVAMEDGPYLNLEVLATFERPRTHSFRRLLGRRGLEGDVFASSTLETQLEVGYGYVLAAESPRTQWAAAGPEEPPLRVAAGPGVGPASSAPDTLGEFMLTTATEPPMRVLVVFVPRIPPRLFAPYGALPTASKESDGAAEPG